MKIVPARVELAPEAKISSHNDSSVVVNMLHVLAPRIELARTREVDRFNFMNRWAWWTNEISFSNLELSPNRRRYLLPLPLPLPLKIAFI
jgi:hypothetical protein